MAKKKHPYSHSHMEHHEDGSITVHHVHASDSKKDVKHAVGSLDAAHDSMEANLGTPNAGEAAAPGGMAPGAPTGAPNPAAGAMAGPMEA